MAKSITYKYIDFPHSYQMKKSKKMQLFPYIKTSPTVNNIGKWWILKGKKQKITDENWNIKHDWNGAFFSLFMHLFHHNAWTYTYIYIYIYIYSYIGAFLFFLEKLQFGDPLMQSHWPTKIFTQSRLGFMALKDAIVRLKARVTLKHESPLCAP